jgi:hypothetical protein
MTKWRPSTIALITRVPTVVPITSLPPLLSQLLPLLIMRLQQSARRVEYEGGEFRRTTSTQTHRSLLIIKRGGLRHLLQSSLLPLHNTTVTQLLRHLVPPGLGLVVPIPLLSTAPPSPLVGLHLISINLKEEEDFTVSSPTPRRSLVHTPTRHDHSILQ